MLNIARWAFPADSLPSNWVLYNVIYVFYFSVVVVCWLRHSISARHPAYKALRLFVRDFMIINAVVILRSWNSKHKCSDSISMLTCMLSLVHVRYVACEISCETRCM